MSQIGVGGEEVGELIALLRPEQCPLFGGQAWELLQHVGMADADALAEEIEAGVVIAQHGMVAGEVGQGRGIVGMLFAKTRAAGHHRPCAGFLGALVFPVAEEERGEVVQREGVVGMCGSEHGLAYLGGSHTVVDGFLYISERGIVVRQVAQAGGIIGVHAVGLLVPDGQGAFAIFHCMGVVAERIVIMRQVVQRLGVERVVFSQC